jgi:hypothetical protein
LEKTLRAFAKRCRAVNDGAENIYDDLRLYFVEQQKLATNTGATLRQLARRKDHPVGWLASMLLEYADSLTIWDLD